MADRLVTVDMEANAKRIENVEKCFFGSLTQPLKVENRILVGEGVLTKMCRKKPKPRQFFLFDDILVYGTIVIARKKYNSMHVIDLVDVKLQSLNDDGISDLKNGWQIISPKKSFSVYAATAQEKVEWMAHINRCVQDLVKKRGISALSSDDSPVWIPDSEANRCMVCNKSEFTVINRKHHCRKCGRVVCNPCSTKRFLLVQQSSKPQRVCDACYDKLTHSSQPVETPPFETQPCTADETSDSSSDEEEESPQVAGPGTTLSDNKPESSEPHFYDSSEVTSATHDVDVNNGDVDGTVTNDNSGDVAATD